jgi:hypothetical protein
VFVAVGPQEVRRSASRGRHQPGGRGPRAVLRGGPQVGVDVERDGRRGVPERPLDGDHVAAGGDEPAGVGVPQVVQRVLLEPRRDADLAPPVSRGIAGERCATEGEQPLPRADAGRADVPGQQVHQLARRVDGALGAVLGQDEAGRGDGRTLHLVADGDEGAEPVRRAAEGLAHLLDGGDGHRRGRATGTGQWHAR